MKTQALKKSETSSLAKGEKVFVAYLEDGYCRYRRFELLDRPADGSTNLIDTHTGEIWNSDAFEFYRSESEAAEVCRAANGPGAESVVAECREETRKREEIDEIIRSNS